MAKGSGRARAATGGMDLEDWDLEDWDLEDWDLEDWDLGGWDLGGWRNQRQSL